MKKLFWVSLAAGTGFVLGVAFLAVCLPVVAGGPRGLPSQNGDVNADGRIDISDGIYLLSFLFQGGPPVKEIECAIDPPPAGSVALPATGQMTCFDMSGSPVDCDSPDFPGQDGHYQAGCPIDGRFVDNGDGTVSDLCTGLMWQRDTPEDLYNWQQALQYCDGLELAGHSDWRLPNVLEILSIQDYGRLAPSIDPAFGPVGSLYWYWSSSSAQDLPNYGWIVSFGVGIAKGWPKADTYHARAVRGGATVPE